MYVPFQQATFLPLNLDAGTWKQGAIELPRVDAIAAKDAAGRVLIALTNVDPTREAPIDIALDRLPHRAASGETLTAPRVDSVNTFDSPRTVAPAPLRTAIVSRRLEATLPPRSVTVITLLP
jgi:alpha-N-arabinofuranosidase